MERIFLENGAIRCAQIFYNNGNLAQTLRERYFIIWTYELRFPLILHFFRKDIPPFPWVLLMICQAIGIFIRVEFCERLSLFSNQIELSLIARKCSFLLARVRWVRLERKEKATWISRVKNDATLEGVCILQSWNKLGRRKSRNCIAMQSSESRIFIACASFFLKGRSGAKIYLPTDDRIWWP